MLACIFWVVIAGLGSVYGEERIDVWAPLIIATLHYTKVSVLFINKEGREDKAPEG